MTGHAIFAWWCELSSHKIGRYMINNPRIIILVNSFIFGSGIQCLLEKAHQDVIGTARTWDELFELLKNSKPDLLVIDLLLMDNMYIESLEKLRSEHAEIPVMLILDEESIGHLTDFIDRGITGFVNYDTSYESLVKAIKNVANGNEYFEEGILTTFKKKQKQGNNSTDTREKQNKLTPREATICKLFCKGLSHKEIGATLNISPRTVETHKKNILSKLKAKSTAELIKYAIDHQLI